MTLYSTESVELASFDPLKIVDKTQTHRIMLTSVEKARLLSLRFVGDVYSFNNIKVISMPYQQYLIQDLENNFEIIFSLGPYDNVIIHSALNFVSKEFNLLDKLASAISVKYLLKTLTGKLKEQSDIPSRLSIDDLYTVIIQVEDDEKVLIKNLYQYGSKKYKGQLKHSITIEEEEKLRLIFSRIDFDLTRKMPEQKREEAYAEFIEQLKTKHDSEILDFLKKYVDYNFQVIPSRDINTNWIHPRDLFYDKKGDYKSIAFFYYFTLEKLGFRVRSYFVIPLKKKDEDTIAIQNRMSDTEKEKLTRQYNKVRDIHNINVLLYEPPRFDDGIYLVSVYFNGYWIYTTGTHWINDGIREAGRVCSHYVGSGCYYTFFRETIKIEYNTMNDVDKVTWDVFYELE